MQVYKFLGKQFKIIVLRKLKKTQVSNSINEENNA
jgi:hypothetical protein